MSPAPPPVLVIEDEDSIREAIIEILADEGFPAVGASDGLGALDLLRKGLRPGLILLDFLMPGMGGGDFRRVQMTEPALASIPVVVLSASPNAQAEMTPLGVEAFIPKPPRLDALLGVVARYCGPALALRR